MVLLAKSCMHCVRSLIYQKNPIPLNKIHQFIPEFLKIVEIKLNDLPLFFFMISEH